MIDSSIAARTKKFIIGIKSNDIKRSYLTGVEIALNVVKYDGVSNFSYEYFDIKDTHKNRFLELVIIFLFT